MFEYFRNVRIKTISYGLIIVMVAAGVIVGFASFSTLREVNDVRANWNSFSETAVKKTGYLSDLRNDLGYGGFIHNFKNAILRRDKSLLDTVTTKQKAALQDIQNYRERGVDAKEETALSDLEDMINEYASKIPTIDAMIDRGATPEQIDSQVQISDTSAIDGIAVLLEHVRQERADYGATVNATMDSAEQYTYLTLTIVAIMIVSLVAVFLWFAQSRLVRPIYALIEFVSRVGRGDLTQQMGNLGRDEVGGLGAQLNQMVVNLKEITVQTREAVANLNSAATETLASTKQQAASVEEQFAAIQETTATLDEISQSGQQMSNRARDIAGQAEKASDRSKDGLKSMDDLAQVMDAIEEQTESVASHIVALSEKTQAIGDIISTVNDIAERSQLLALNAAIEAAAAGEEGRSFSVVAEEIRTLADQAKEATTQVSSILGDIQKGINASVMSTEESVKRVANGREQAENTLKSITELAETIEASVQAFEQIVASTNQQKIGLEQVTQALQQIRTGSEQTAAGTKQIEQAVTNINSLGSQLDHTMERYAV